MNVKRFNIFILVILLVPAGAARAVSLSEIVGRGNQLYEESRYVEALRQYEQAAPEEWEDPVIMYNRANCYYKLEDYREARILYEQVSAKSKDMELVVRAKYNLGNCHFQGGMKQLDSDLQKAFEELSTSVRYYREVLDIKAEDADAAHNIAVARLIMKDLLDKIKKEQEKQQQQQQQNQLAEKIRELLRRQGELLQQNIETQKSMPDPNKPSAEAGRQLTQQADEQGKLREDTTGVNDEAEQMLNQLPAPANMDPNMASQVQQQKDILETVVRELNQAADHQGEATDHLTEAQAVWAAEEQLQAAESLYRALEAFPQQPQPQQDQQQQQDQPQEQQQDQQQSQEQQQFAAPDTTARDILNQEKERRKQRVRRMPGGYQKVDKDW
ncbi:MAG: hypothetical protein AMJ79_04675 [Phycisphaerae bacterium SM23_30]|nr:MAG: hypothetical protein AMJ79_04675 [Phycisphaerae bacterium SM23_30]